MLSILLLTHLHDYIPYRICCYPSGKKAADMALRSSVLRIFARSLRLNASGLYVFLLRPVCNHIGWVLPRGFVSVSFFAHNRSETRRKRRGAYQSVLVEEFEKRRSHGWLSVCYSRIRIVG